MKLDLFVGGVESYCAKPADLTKLGPVTFEVRLDTSPFIGDIVLRSRQKDFCAWAARLRCNEIVTVEFSDSGPIVGAAVSDDPAGFVPPLRKVVEKTPGN